MLYITLSLILGYLLKKIFPDSRVLELFSSKTVSLSVFCMVGLIGLSISSNEMVLSSLVRIGLLSFVFCVAGMFGSIIFVYPLSVKLHAKKTDSNKISPGSSNTLLFTVVKEIIPTVGIFFTAIVIGLLLRIELSLINLLITINLYLLLFFTGVCAGNVDFISVLKKNNYFFLLFPLLALAGSLITTLGFNLLLGTGLPKGGAGIGAGMGYYSIAAVLNKELSSDFCGILALTSNLMREIFTIIFCPILVKIFGPLAPISTGGATSMDTTLPFIRKYSGEEFFLLAFMNGVILTLLVPLVISLVLNL